MNAALQRIGAPPAAVSTPARGRYQQVIVLDEFREASVSLNAGDKLGDVTHGEMVLAIVNAGINGGRRPHEAGWVPGLLSGPCELRYRGQLAFFTHDAAGRLQPLANDSGFSARQPSANSWATPAAIPR